MKTLFVIFALFIGTANSIAQQSKQNPYIDLTEKQAFERYKKSNIRKALGLTLKDFNYKDLVQNGQTDKLSEIMILNETKDKTFISFIQKYYSFSDILGANKLPLCDDCSMIIYNNIKQAKTFDFRGYNYNSGT